MKKQSLNPLFGSVLKPLQQFFALEASSAIVLLGCAVFALLVANTDLEPSFRALLHAPIGLSVGSAQIHLTLEHIINDGLMTVFFFVVGMEIKRELVVGELSSVRNALLPGIAALGGMIVPAGIYFLLNHDSAGRSGWGIPMATDIAFSIGVLTLLRSRVPHALIVFLTALAIFDDIGGILVIAIFYGHGLSVQALVAAAAITGVLVVIGKLGVKNGLVYALGAIALWYAVLSAGVHPTIAGVIAGLTVPATTERTAMEVLRELYAHLEKLVADPNRLLDNAEILAIEEELEDLEPPLERFVHALHPFVAFGVMPLFALANSGVRVVDMGAGDMLGSVSAGVFFGLVIGKTVGVASATLLAVKMKVAEMPGGASVSKLIGVAAVSGIGFTVALFIGNLAFSGAPEMLGQAKIGILAGSFVAGVLGAALLRATSVTPVPHSKLQGAAHG